MTDSDSYPHSDALSALNQTLSMRDKLRTAHRTIQETLPFIARIAITLHDPEAHTLKTYIDSSGDGSPLDNYETNLENTPSLMMILEVSQPRVINNMLTVEDGKHEHT